MWAYDGSGDEDLAGPYHLQVYPAPKNGAEMAVISYPDFHGETDYFVGVRASKIQGWQPFFHLRTSSHGRHWIPSYAGWSRDGSVVALGDDARDYRWSETGPGSFQASDGFRAAYDLRAAKAYQPTPQLSKTASRQISQLLSARGGWKLNNTALGNRGLGSWRWQDADCKQLIAKIREREQFPYGH